MFNSSKKILILGLTTLFLGSVFGHEFWLEPQRFLVKVGEKINFRVFVGENFKGEFVDFSQFSVTSLAQYRRGNKQETGGSLSEKQVADFLKFDAEGLSLVAFNNTNKFIELEAQKFNEYLKSDGLDNVKELRKQRGEMNRRGREVYQRCAKTLLMVGKNIETDTTYRLNTGMKLEIIPQQNPYGEAKELTFSVLFDTHPLPNALVVVWYKNGKQWSKREFRSNEQGQVRFGYTKHGKWMVSTVRMIPVENNPQADWQSYWGSYTFGFQ